MFNPSKHFVAADDDTISVFVVLDKVVACDFGFLFSSSMPATTVPMKITTLLE